MKVVFLETVEGTAVVGDVKEVKNGFARNYLLPRGLAAPAKEPHLERARAGAVREARKQEALDKDASAIAERLEGQKITMIARVGEQGKLYGSITSVHIAEEVAKLLGEDAEFDHRKVLLPEAIKEIGVQPIRLRLTRNVEAAIEVEVVPEDLEEDDIPIDPDADASGDETAEADPDADESSTDDAEEASEEPKAELEEESPEDTDGDTESSDEVEAADESAEVEADEESTEESTEEQP
ncbi:MAG: 50S ribosomal protein L9 [Chloroflexi bacterium]|nr:50S ribosomal protein L9 [Chloroflexota bacterium]